MNFCKTKVISHCDCRNTSQIHSYTVKTRMNVSQHQAMKVARTDAQRLDRDLSIYRISVSLEADGWQIDYELKEDNRQGGGPHYLIEAQSGEILSKRYEQ